LGFEHLFEGCEMRRVVRFKPSRKRAEEIEVAVVGLGKIGVETASLIWRRDGLRLVGLVDTSPALLGRDLAELAGLERPTGVRVVSSIDLLDRTPEVAVLTTTSSFESIHPTLRRLVSMGINVVSSSEEMIYPWLSSPELAEDIDRLCREMGVVAYGTGVNPGFVMDRLPAFLAGACQEIRSVEVIRVVDASTRRRALQAKIGSGLTVEEFEALVASGRIGHVGLVESAAYLADRLGLDVVEIEEELKPVVSDRRVRTEFFDVPPGKVIGIRQTAVGRDGTGEEVVKLRLEMFLDAESPRDEIRIRGVPDLDVEIKGGTPGDQATAAILVNAIPLVMSMEPGLRA